MNDPLAKKCSLCNKKVMKADLEHHIFMHIEKSYQDEERTFKNTQRMRELYRKLFKKEI